MGSGKGSFNTWLWKFQKFQKIFEISFFLKYFLIKKYLIKIKKKIPFKIYFSTR
jgi:ribosomal protein L16/L10AE